MKSNEVFKMYPKLSSYHQTSDGVKFFTPHDAMAHARSLKDKKVTEVFKGETPEGTTGTDNTDKVKKLNPMQAAKLRVDAVGAMATVAEVEAALKGETANSVKDAGALRIKEIQDADAAKETAKSTGATEGVEDAKEDNNSKEQ